MPSSEYLLKRLTRLNHPAECVLQPRPGLSETALIRLADILDALTEGRVAMEDDIELQGLLAHSRMVHFSKAEPWRETSKQRRERMMVEKSFSAVFHDLAMQDSAIAVPSYDNDLNAYHRSHAISLLKRHGWVPGEYDCSNIVPLNQWSASYKEQLIEFYRCAKPENPLGFPPGWQTKYDPERWDPFCPAIDVIQLFLRASKL